MRICCFRLHPGADLYLSLQAFVREQALPAAVPLACAGSLSAWRVRCADGQTLRQGDGPVEILSLTGTLGCDGLHLHIGLAREDLSAFGGHLREGCIVHTTAEIVLGAPPGVQFAQALDSETGYRELVVEAIE